MPDVRRVVLVELNEVPLRVVQRFTKDHPSSAFAKILRDGASFETVTPDEGHLSPWITWPTLHRGVPRTKHHLTALGQDSSDADKYYPPIWALLERGGRRVGIFGSLHSYPLPPNVDSYDFYVPDTFAAGPETKPPELSAFQAFNLRMVDRSGRNVSSHLPAKEAFAFLRKALPNGLRLTTLAKVARQLATERIWRDRIGRRRTIQSLLAFDLFHTQLQLKKPDVAFFFTNHVASSMHRYWPATFTEDYHETTWKESWIRRFSGELDYAMGEANEMLEELMDFADRHPEYLIFVTGSMGQAAVDSAEKQIKTEVLVRDLNRFLAELGVNGVWHRRRTMEPTYTLTFEEPETADTFMTAVSTVKIAGTLVQSRRLDARAIEFVLGHPNVPEERFTVSFGDRVVNPAQAGLANVMIDDEVGSVAYHVPEGMLLVYDPQLALNGGMYPSPVLTTRIAPTLLVLQGITPPEYMEDPIRELISPQLEPA